MAASTGRGIAMTWNALALLGVRQKAITINGESINISSDEDSGWQTLLAESGEQSVNLAISGVTKSKVLKTDWFAGTRTRAVILTYWDGSSISGNFRLADYKETGNYKEAVTFEATLQSTGTVTFTPGA